MSEEQREERPGSGTARAIWLVAGVLLALVSGVGVSPFLGLRLHAGSGNHYLATGRFSAEDFPRPVGFSLLDGKLFLRNGDSVYFWWFREPVVPR